MQYRYISSLILINNSRMDASLDKLKCVLDQWSRATNALFAVECLIQHANDMTVYDMMQLQEMASKYAPFFRLTPCNVVYLMK